MPGLSGSGAVYARLAWESPGTTPGLQENPALAFHGTIREITHSVCMISHTELTVGGLHSVLQGVVLE